ncbi:MAG: hypothetical protein IJX20_04850, partial [Alphaproteobacteria bacterium]|nr:hypothetical protein [Alphaproteobacteria bacterium]
MISESNTKFQAGTLFSAGISATDEELVNTLTGTNNYSIAMVMTYGESKTFLGADSLIENEKAWLANE